MWPWHVKMATQNLLKLLLLWKGCWGCYCCLMLMLRNVLTIVWCRFGSWSLVIKSNFCPDFEHKFVKILKLKLLLGREYEDEIWWRFIWELVIWPESEKPRQHVSNADRKVFANPESFCNKFIIGWRISGYFAIWNIQIICKVPGWTGKFLDDLKRVLII